MTFRFSQNKLVAVSYHRETQGRLLFYETTEYVTPARSFKSEGKEYSSRPPTSSLVRHLSPKEIRISLFFALAITMVPWAEIFRVVSGTSFADREVYTSDILNYTLSIDLDDYSAPLSYVTGEYGWGVLLRFLSRDLGFTPEIIFFLVSLFVLTVSSLYVVRYASTAFLPLLIIPPFVDLSFSQMRMALAFALALAPLAFAIRRHWLRLILLLLAITVHTAIPALIALYAAVSVIVRFRLSHRPMLQYALITLVGLSFGLLVGPLRQGMLDVLDDRRLETAYTSSIPIMFVVWLILGILITLNWSDTRRSVPALYSLSLFLAIPLLLLGDGYPDRYLATSIPLIVSGMYALRDNYRAIAITVYVVFFLIRWLYWLRVL